MSSVAPRHGTARLEGNRIPPCIDRSSIHQLGRRCPSRRSMPRSRRALAAALVPILSIAVTASRCYPAARCSCAATRWAARAPSSRARRPTRTTAFQPFWDTYHTINDRYAGGEVDRDALVQGAIRGMIDSLEDPYSAYLTRTSTARACRASAASSRDRRRDRDPGAGWDPGLRDARRRLPAGHHRAARRLAGREGRPAAGRPRPRDRRRLARRADGRRRARADPRPEGHGRRAVDPARRRQPIQLRSSATSSRGRRSSRASWPTDGRLPAARTASRIAPPRTSRRRSGPTSRPAAEAHPRPARQPRRLRHRRARGREPVHRLGADLLGEDAEGGADRDRGDPGGVATDPTIQVVVLIDGGSASASEIVAGGAPGQRPGDARRPASFGKGTVQQWQELTGEGGAFRLTDRPLADPDKRWIHKSASSPTSRSTSRTLGPGRGPDARQGARGPGRRGAARASAWS